MANHGASTGPGISRRRTLLALGGGAAAATLGRTRRAVAQSGAPVTIGVLTDMSGTFAPNAGMGSVTAVQMAVDDVGIPARIVHADHQNKPDVGSAIAREWLDTGGVDAIIDMPNSAVALAAMRIARERNKVALVTGAASPAISNEACMATGFQWTFDTIQWANAMASALMAKGGTSWFFITPDYTFGIATETDISNKVRALGGTVVGGVRYPLNAPDFAQYLVQAQASGAKVLALGSAGTDLITVVKQADEFGLVGHGMLITGLLQPTEVSAIGLTIAHGILAPTAFDPNRTPETQAWAERYTQRMHAFPTMTHAGTYSAARHYLQAVRDSGTKDATAVAARMKATPVNDIFASNGVIRADNLLVHNWYMQQVKEPGESKGPNDLFRTVATVPGAEVVRPLAQSTCPLVRS